MTNNLAILGHLTRGKTVISILEMLGGKNVYNLTGNRRFAYYIIDSNKEIKGGSYIFGDEDYIFCTVEDFLKIYPYKVGDKVNSPCSGCVKTITSMEWDSYLNTVTYKLDDKIYTTIEQLKIVNNLPTIELQSNEENKPDLLQQLKDYFANTPREIIEKEWHEYDKYNEIEPTVKEYLEYVNKIYKIK